MKRRICVITGSRADYGLLRWLMHGIAAHQQLELQVVVTGSHLSPEFGNTQSEIIEDGFKIEWRVDALINSDSSVSIAKSMGLGMIGFADCLNQLKPDLILVLGDRFETFAAVSAGLVAQIPVAHLHGGELTQGAFDDALRHAITKMSHLHFVANEIYRQRVIQLGESPARVWTTGGLGVDAIHRVELLGKADLEAELGFRLGPKNLLVTHHPTTLVSQNGGSEMSELLFALDQLKDTHCIITSPNADTQGLTMRQQIQDFVRGRPNFHFVPSLGQRKYLSCVALFDGVIGNSSSGLTEVPSFRKPTINIGERQSGRLAADSVIHCATDHSSILKAIERMFSGEFQSSLSEVRNPYGEGKACEQIIEVLRSIELNGLINKAFHEVQP